MATVYADVMQTTDLPDALRVIYSSELDFTARPALLFDQFVEIKNEFRAMRGEEVYWTIYRQLPPAIDALTENVDVDGGKMSDFQVHFTVDEYGYAIGTTEKLDLLSYHGPISNIVRQVLAPQMALSVDLLARNAFIGAGATYRSFAGTATSHADMSPGNAITSDLIRRAAHNLSVRRVPLRGGGYVAICHPSITYDIRGQAEWKDAHLYAGSANIFSGETGMLHGVRFIECDTARLPNAGAVVVQTTLTSAANPGQSYVVVSSTSGFAAGQEISLFDVADDRPTGARSSDEHVVIASVASGTRLNLRTKLLVAHDSGDKVMEAEDIYPVVLLGGQNPVGKGVVVAPEIRVAPPTDKLHRIHYVGWYALLGYGVIRPEAMELLMLTSSVSSAPAFPW